MDSFDYFVFSKVSSFGILELLAIDNIPRTKKNIDKNTNIFFMIWLLTNAMTVKTKIDTEMTVIPVISTGIIVCFSSLIIMSIFYKENIGNEKLKLVLPYVF